MNVKRICFFILILGMFFNEISVFASLSQLTERQKIEFLIQSVERMEGAQFYRNGEWHTAKEAGAHLRMKLDYAGKRIKTAQQFIDKLASTSSVSGKPYKIKYKDGKTVDAKDFFEQQLKKIENK